MAKETADFGDVAMMELFRQSGYANDPASVTLKLIADYLRSHSDLLARWHHYSQDCRSGDKNNCLAAPTVWRTAKYVKREMESMLAILSEQQQMTD